MNIRSLTTPIIVAGALAVSLGAGAFLVLTQPPSAGGHRLGTVHFPISCTAVQEDFDHAVALLHNFFYPETVKAFQAITAKDPDCAIAYWGLAMSQRPNPLVTPFPAANMKAAWDAIERGKAAPTKTPREAAYLAAMETYFKDYDAVDHKIRVASYEQAMQRLYEANPTDSEAKIFYALSLNEAVDLNDKALTKQRKAGALLNEEAKSQPDHPGIAHYTIHSYDYAALAALCVPTADQYGRIASDSPHALHMPSHIYSTLGMWESSIRANIASEAAARTVAAANNPGAPTPQVPHGMDFRTYAYLQLGKDEDAKKAVDAAATIASPPEASLTFETALAAIPARYVLERGRWEDAAALAVRESRYAAAQSISRFARALGAARAGRTHDAHAELAQLDELETRLASAGDDYWAGQTRIQKHAATAWILLAEGRRDDAIAAMLQAAELEEGSEKNIAMENRLMPMRELLGELYLALGMNGDALSAFDAALKVAPNRFRTIAGAARAARAQGSTDVAKRHYAALMALAPASDADRPDVAEARVYLARN